jgi:hypothetical protein
VADFFGKMWQYPGAPATAQNQTTMITFGPTIATPRIAQKFRK